MNALVWLQAHKKLVAAVVVGLSCGLRAYGVEGAAHVLELIAAALFGGGLRSDAAVKKDHFLR